MANVDSIFGARYLGTLGGGGEPKTRTFLIPATDNTAVFMGDFVTHQGTSAVWSVDGALYPVVAQSAASDRPVGFVSAVRPSRDYENQIYRSASTERLVDVIVDPYALFEIQTSGTFAVGNVGANADFTVGAGSTVTGLSGMELDQTTVATTDTLPLNIVGMVPRADNEVGANAKLICMLNNSAYKPPVTGF